MSEVHKEEKAVEVAVIPELKLRRFTVRDILPITSYLKELGLMDLIMKMMGQGADAIAPLTWGDIRRETGMSDKELKELQEETNHNPIAAANLVGLENKSEADLNEDLMNKILELISEDVKFKKTVEFISYLYDTDPETILDLELAELMKAIQGVMGSKDFLSLVS